MILLTSCGDTLPLVDGGGLDAGQDVDVSDATMDAVVGIDAPIDVTPDVDASDAAVPLPDAPYVDLDAATAPWAQSYGPGSFNSIAVDGKLNVVAGGVLNFSGSYTSYFVQAVDKAGGSLWKATATTNKTSQEHQALAVTFDASGNVYATGYTTDAMDVGAGAKGPGGFLVKYDATGAFKWEYGPFANTRFTGVGVKSSGNVVVVGGMMSSEDYGGGIVTSNGARDAVLVEVTSSASYVRSKHWGDTGDQMAFQVAIDYLDNLVLTGRFESMIDFGGGALTGPMAGSGSYNSFIAKLDSTAGYLHQKDAKAAGNNDSLPSVACDWKGDVFVAGFVSSYTTMNLGGTTLSCGGAVVAELDSSLGHLWSRCYMHTAGGNVAADPTTGTGLAGFYQGNADFGQGTLPASQGPYLARFDSTGTSTASFGAGSTTYFSAVGPIAFMTWPDFVVAGTCNGPVALPSGTLTCTNNEAFVARLAP